MTAGPMPTADEIFGQQFAPPPWLSSRPLLDLAMEVLPLGEDDLAADLLEQLALALIDRDDEVRGVRAVAPRSTMAPRSTLPDGMWRTRGA